MTELETAGARATGLTKYLRERRDEIARELDRELRALPSAPAIAGGLSADALRSVLDAIADLADQLATGRSAEPPRALVERYAAERLRAEIGVAQLVRELSSVRDVLSRRCEHEGTAREQRCVSHATDLLLAAAADRYAELRERGLRALERVSADAMESSGVRDLVRRLARSLAEGIRSADTTGVLVCEDQQLRLCASVGLEDEVERGFALEMGEGFAGRVFRESRPILLRAAADDPMVVCDGIRRRSVRALYGVPLLHRERVLGVAYVGSTTVADFDEEERELACAMASRAALGLRHQLKRAWIERHAAELRRSECLVREANEALRVGQERLRLAVDLTGLGTWEWDLATNGMDWSERAKAIFGLSPDDRPDPERLSALLGSEHRASHDELLRRAKAGEDVGTFAHDHRIVRSADGEERWVACRARVSFDAERRPRRVFAALLDVTEQKRSELRARRLAEAGKLLASSLDYRTTLGHVAEMVVPELADYCSVDVLRDDHTLGDHVGVAHRDPDGADLARQIRSRYGPPPVLLEVMRTRTPLLISHADEASTRAHANDEEHLALLTRLNVHSVMIVPLTVRDEAFGALTLAHTESGRHFVEHDLATAEELARMASTAIENARLHEATREAVQLRDRILALVSHDLRTPLTAIDLSGAVLLETPQARDDRFLHKQLEIIRRNAARMSRLIGDLLDMSSIQSGRLTLELRRCVLAPLLAESVESQLAIAEEKGVALRAELDIQGDDVSMCDRDRIHQVLANLIGNAIKFCERGGSVTLRAECGGGEARISVTDTGPGIAPEDIEHVFELFWKGKVGAQRGTGLGLFIARGLVEAHHGRMWVDSRTGGGSRFCFTLPLVTGDAGSP